MRIIGGRNKGKKIYLPIDKNTRPLRDLVKESIFNLIEHSNKFNVTIQNSIVLDLFSGTGSFGLECHSRGAKLITFVENYVRILDVLKKNISYQEVLKSIKNRDKSDFNRKISPLKKTKDSLLINTTNLNKRACFLKIKKIIDRKIKF